MGLNELLDQIRDDYLDQLLAAIEEKGAQPGHRVIAEPALRMEDGKLVVEGDLQLPVRTDVAVMQGDAVSDVFNIENESLIKFDAVEFDWGKTLHVEMGPFAWHSLSITMPGDPTYNWAPMQDWFWKWFHDDAAEDEGPSLIGAVHFLSDPVAAGDIVEMSLDLGSAPIAAFEELLDALSASGVTLCAIGQVLGTTEE